MSETLSQRLLRWYERNGDKYRFRETRDAYRILVCAVLLRRTTARQVSDVYDVFFSRFPDVKSLASASVREIGETIRPLGIRRRARELSKLAKRVSGEYGGRIPDDLVTLTSLEGVGRYVASCVLAFAYNKKVPMVDANVERVIRRVRGLEASGRGHPDERVWQAYSEIAPAKRLGEFHYALIDLSHKVCRAERPSCATCPIATGYDYATRRL